MNKFQQKINRKQSGSVKWLNQKNSDALPFWVADADYKTAPVVIDALIERVKMGDFGYTSVSKECLESIRNWYISRYGVVIKTEWIIPLPDVLATIKMAIDAFTNEGDEIIIQTPVYFQFNHLIKISKRVIVENKLVRNNGYYTIDFMDLEQKFQKGAKMLILCSPHNPVGRLWTKEELQKIIDLCKKYKIYLISDEIHGDLIRPGSTFYSIGNWFQEPIPLIICSAPSKTFNLAGLRCAYAIIANNEIRKSYQDQVIASVIPSVNLLGIVATTTAYRDGSSWVDLQNKHIEKNYQVLIDYLNKYLPKIGVASLEATYLCWLDLTSYKLSSEELVNLLSIHGLTVSSGYAFGEDYDGFIRFNIACPTVQLIKGLEILKKVLIQQKTKNN